MTPFEIKIPQDDIDDLRWRIERARWPSQPAGTSWERGVPLEQLKALAKYWSTEFDWWSMERRLNELPNFVTTIDGASIHFLHVRSPEPHAQPMILTHGWPGSFVEFLDIIGPLTDPRAHGADPSSAFHLVIPSIPGFGFSKTNEEPGWTTHRVARAWVELMRSLGYDEYIAQGGDAGTLISLELARMAPDHVLGVHVNMLMTFPSDDPEELADLSEADQQRLANLARFDNELSGYLKLQSTRPQTLAYALTDSPIGQLAWIAEKFHDWTDSTDALDAVNRDLVLTIVTIYWLTASAGSSAQLYYEDAENLRLAAQGQAPPSPTVPVGVAVFPHDIFVPLRRLAERDLSTITHWTELDRGGHFAAMEQPELLVDDVRTFARSLNNERASTPP